MGFSLACGIEVAQDWCKTITQDAVSEYHLLEACILVNIFQDNEPENENKTKLSYIKLKMKLQTSKKEKVKQETWGLKKWGRCKLKNQFTIIIVFIDYL